MSTTAQTWFYKEPEHRPYFIEERLNGTFWSARIGNVVFDCIRAEPPFLARSYWYEHPFDIEWQPQRWLALRMNPEIPELISGVEQVLGFKPAFRYEDADNRVVVEWHVDGGQARWQAIQGIPKYKHPRRLNL